MLLQVKKYSGKLLLPLAKKIKRIPANYFTLAGLVSAVVAFFGFLFQNIVIIIVCLFVTEFFDQLDGVVARLQGPTKLGSFLDSTLDRIGDFVLFFGLILGYTSVYGYSFTILGLIAVSGAFLTSYTRAKIEALGIDNLYGVGILERTDRVPIMLIGSIFLLFFRRLRLLLLQFF